MKKRNLFLPILLAGISGAVTLWLRHGGPLSSSEEVNQKDLVAVGKDYYVSVKLVELESLDPRGNAWDSVDSSAPDISVDLLWRGQRVYRSTMKSDTLIAKWSNGEIDLRRIALTGEKTSVESLISAARISIHPKEQIELVVYDQDLLGVSDEAGRVLLETAKLKVGDTTIDKPAPGIRRIEVTVSSMDSLPDVGK